MNHIIIAVTVFLITAGITHIVDNNQSIKVNANDIKYIKITLESLTEQVEELETRDQQNAIKIQTIQQQIDDMIKFRRVTNYTKLAGINLPSYGIPQQTFRF